MAGDEGHPVFEVYNLLRTTDLNVEYWSAKLERLKKRSRMIELALSWAAPSSALSGIASIAIDDFPIGQYAWITLSAVAGLLALAKPILRLEDQIGKYESTLSDYRALLSELDQLRSEIRFQESFSETLQHWFLRIQRRFGAAEQSSPGEPTDTALRDELQVQIERRYPPNTLWVPRRGA